MSALFQIAKHHIKVRLEYRGSFLFSLFLHPLVMLLTMLMFKGIYRHHELRSLFGYSLGQIVWYFGAAQFFYYLVWNMVDKNISEKVLYGRMEEQLLRPYSLLAWEFVQLTSQKLLAVLFEFIPVFLIYLLIWYPDFLTLSGLAQYLALTALAFVQFFLMSFLLGLLAFLWHDVSSANVLKFIVVNLLAGVSLPIAFFPGSLQTWILALPFHYLFHTPVAHLLGTVNVDRWSDFAGTVLGQLTWILLLFLLAELGCRRALARFLSVGG